ncbi:MAG TPA: type II toxin-antitoxin system prevent-host-death family antitoxin [Planctomycetes bacterium]|nr:type II toxin-antitoxin system prevent-host-death family antitoxin [Planctomycetota bacterium]
MKTVPIQELKKNLASLVDEAAAGSPILITRHKRPLACLVSSAHRHVIEGARFGKGTLRSVLRAPTKGRYLSVLDDDRQARSRTGRE